MSVLGVARNTGRKRTVKNPLWKQQDPFDQLTVLLMDLQGTAESLHTAQELDSRTRSSAARMDALCEQIRELTPYLKGSQPWLNG